MPITPFHFGPGLAVKGLAPRHFSWSAFVASQVVIDCETAYNIAMDRYPLHRELHTGALLLSVRRTHSLSDNLDT